MSKEIEALLNERQGYLNRNLVNRVAQVDAELAKFNIAVESASVEPAIETASMPKAKKRKVTTDGDN
jgi:hypothetical protein